MSELITNLNNILDIKGNIKSAIENKGVDSYKSANYWSYFSTQIFPIE